MSTAAVPQDPGKIRGLQRVTTEAGFFEICALDHLSDFAELLAADPATVTFADVIAAKDALVRALSPSVSAFLLDARYGLQTVVTGALPGTVGLMASIEDEDYSIPDGPRRTRYREGWSMRQIKLARSRCYLTPPWTRLALGKRWPGRRRQDAIPKGKGDLR